MCVGRGKAFIRGYELHFLSRQVSILCTPASYMQYPVTPRESIPSNLGLAGKVLSHSFSGTHIAY